MEARYLSTAFDYAKGILSLTVTIRITQSAPALDDTPLEYLVILASGSDAKNQGKSVPHQRFWLITCQIEQGHYKYHSR